MAHSDTFPVGYKFHPRDDELVGYYLYNKVRGTPFRDENVIPEIDLYGSMEARDIWNNNGGQNLEKDEDLYFFTKLKPAKGTGSRVARTIGSGTWKGETAGAEVQDPKTKETIGFFKRYQYKNTKYPQESGCWIMHEFSLHPKQVMRINSSPSSRPNDAEYVVCRVRKNFDRKRKAEDHEETGGVQSQSKRIRMQSENIDESYVTPMSSEVNSDRYNQQQQEQTTINATSTSSSISVTNVDQPLYYYCEPEQYSEVINQYEIPQATATSDPLNVTNLPTRPAEQQHYFVIQDPTVASSSLAMAGPDNQEQQMQSNVTDLPQYYYDTEEPMTIMAMPDDYVCVPELNFVVDPAMASSLGMSMSSQEDYLQHNGFVTNVMTGLPQYYYSSTQDPSTVSSQYDPPQTATTGFANQPHYFVTQDHQPDYVVADPIVASSLASPANLHQNHHIMDMDQLLPLNFDYTPGDTMIDLDDLWNN
ncbi:NAC domain-containing protein 71-like [Pyrus x bretschneideri]|uniref:NAC domain-containing protein 71-like n=1 Tax=Pyrus x bretschneideri TaxID=225117 RepID=UPI00202E93C5|nr:NAC domain-containing protein 71-like [Pyrus x bretschneideri]